MHDSSADCLNSREEGDESVVGMLAEDDTLVRPEFKLETRVFDAKDSTKEIECIVLKCILNCEGYDFVIRIKETARSW